MAAYGSTPSISSLEQGRRLSTPSLGACLPVGMPVSTIQSDLGSLTAGPFSLLVRDTAPGQESALPYGTSAHASSTISYLPKGLYPGVGLLLALATAGADIASNVSLDSGQGDGNGLTRRWSTGSNEH